VVVTDGHTSNQVVVLQGDKVVTLNIEDNCVEQTWYGGTGRTIKSAVPALGLFDTIKLIMVVNKDTIVWGDSENKVENSEMLKLHKDIRQLFILDKIHWVVFEDGSIEQLRYFKTNDREEWVKSSLVVEKEVTILQTRLTQTSSHIVLTHLVENKSTMSLEVVQGNVVLDSVSQTHTVTSVSRTPICLAAEVVCFDLAQDSVAMIRTSGALCIFNILTKLEEEVMLLPSTLHSSVTYTGINQVAIMGSLSEGGFLKIVNTQYKAVVADTKVKTTSHKGKGMFLVGGKLFLAISSRILSLELGSHLRGGLDTMLGKLAEPQTQISYNVIPDLLKHNDTTKLESVINNLQDIPEQLILDCILHFLDSEIPEVDLQHNLCILMSRNISPPVMSEEVTRLSMKQVIKMCKILDTLINQNQEEVLIEDKNLLEWVSLLLTSHYMQFVVSRDQDTLEMVNRLQDTVKQVQESAKVMVDSKVLVHNIMNTKLPPVKNNNLAYCIEIIQI